MFYVLLHCKNLDKKARTPDVKERTEIFLSFIVVRSHENQTIKLNVFIGTKYTRTFFIDW